MSKKQAIAFFEEISKNQQLAQKVEKVVKGKVSDEAKAKELISLAKKHNFNFTKEEAASAQEALKKPLSPEEMLEVSGGKLNLKSSLMAAAMLLGLGASGAALHNMETSAMKRSTPPDGSYSFGGKRSKIDPPNSTQGQTLPGFDELVSGLSNRAPQGQPTTTGTQQQAPPQLAGATTPEQGETSPGNGQGAAPSNLGQTMRMTPPLRPRTTSGEERHTPRQLNESEKHDREAAKRYSGVDGCGYHQVDWSRRVSASGALPAADWPAAPPVDLEAENGVCRFCGGTLSARGKKARDVKCANAGCIYHWVFHPTGDKHLKGNQRGQLDYGHYARWALLPALILDSRHEHINSTGNRGKGAARTFPIETPAEAWAVWQLIVGHHDRWVDVERMMKAHGVDKTTRNEVIRRLEESYDNLVLGNEHLRAIGLGSEVQQLVEGWKRFRATMEKRFLKGETDEELTKAKKSIDIAVELMDHAYNMLTDDQLKAVDYDPTDIRRDSTNASAEIESAHQRFEKSMQPVEEARETARQQAIETLQRREELSVAQANAIKSELKCSSKTCGNIGAGVHQVGRRAYFYCPKCRKGISKKPANLLAMLEEVAAENAPMEMANAEQDEPQMQMRPEIQPMQMNQGDGFNFGGQDMNQFYTAQPTQQIFVPNLFNANNEHSFHIQHIPVFQMDINQNNTQQQHGQLDLVMQQNAQVVQDPQLMTYQPGLNFDPTQILQQLATQQNGTQPQQNLNPQPTLNLDLHYDPVGDYVNALNAETQALAQYTGMLLELISTGQAANVAQIVEVEIAAQTVVNRVFARELQDQANQIILNTLGADNRYLGAAQAFSDQLEIFNNALDMIGNQWK